MTYYAPVETRDICALTTRVGVATITRQASAEGLLVSIEGRLGDAWDAADALEELGLMFTDACPTASALIPWDVDGHTAQWTTDEGFIFSTLMEWGVNWAKSGRLSR